MNYENAPRRGPRPGYQKASPKLRHTDEELERYNDLWPARLKAGFDSGSVFFAWLMVASRPQDPWPDWCRKYLVDVATRLLNTAEKSDSYLTGVRNPRALTDLKKAFKVLGIKSPKATWSRAKYFWSEYELYCEDPKYESQLLFRGIQLSQRDLILHDHLVEEIERKIRERAKSDNISRLQAGEDIASEGVEFDLTKDEPQAFESVSSMRRAMRRRRVHLENRLVEYGSEI